MLATRLRGHRSAILVSLESQFNLVWDNGHRDKNWIVRTLISSPPSTAPALAGGTARRWLISYVTAPACPQATENERLLREKQESFRDSDFRNYDQKKLLFLDVTLAKNQDRAPLWSRAKSWSFCTAFLTGGASVHWIYDVTRKHREQWVRSREDDRKLQ